MLETVNRPLQGGANVNIPVSFYPRNYLKKFADVSGLADELLHILPLFSIMQHPIFHNENEHRFEVTVDGETALLEYRLQTGIMSLLHTEVPEALEGHGIGSQLANFALEHARSHNIKLKVYCSFVKTYMQRHPEYDEFLA